MNNSTVRSEELFSESWISHEIKSNDLIQCTLNISPDQIVSLNRNSFKEYRKECVESSLKYTGTNPAIMLSGVDSQVTVYSFLEAGYNISPVILDYEGYNSIDVECALSFCEQLKLTPTLVNHPVTWILNKKVIELGTTYGLRSPQFTCHAYACYNLKNTGYTGAIFGGNSFYYSNIPSYGDNIWAFTHTGAQLLDLATYSKAIDWPIMNSFTSWTWSHGICLGVLSSQRAVNLQERYEQKIKAYKAYGIPILRQDTKHTGFEEIKRKIDTMDKDGYFELKYRVPLYEKTPNQRKMDFILTAEQEQALNEMKEKWS